MALKDFLGRKVKTQTQAVERLLSIRIFQSAYFLHWLSEETNHSSEDHSVCLLITELDRSMTDSSLASTLR